VNLPVVGSRFWLLAWADCSRFLIPFIILPAPATAVARGDQGGGDGARGGGSGGDEVGMCDDFGDGLGVTALLDLG
jgi:hypothetical protein